MAVAMMMKAPARSAHRAAPAAATAPRRRTAGAAAAPRRAAHAAPGPPPPALGGAARLGNAAARSAVRPGARRVAARSWRGGGGGPALQDIGDRVVAALAFLIPLFDGLRYCKFLFMSLPFLGALISPLEPLIRLYYSVPFASVAVFFGVYLGVVQNASWARSTRFAAMQACLLSICLILPGLVESVVRFAPSGGPALQIYVTYYNTIGVFVLACVGAGVGGALLGRAVRLPLLADAADRQVN